MTVFGSLELDIASHELDRLLVQLPRLVLLVRAARGDLSDLNTAAEATKLAQELHDPNSTLALRSTIARIMARTKVTPTIDFAAPVSTSFQFGSVVDFVFSNRYFVFRLLLAALTQSIRDLNYDKTFGRVEAEADDLWAAKCILQSVEWAFKPDSNVHMTMLRMLVPIQLGYGTWDRSQRRQSSHDTPDYQLAVQMKAASIKVANEIDHKWDNRVTMPWKVGHICKMFAGGPRYD